MTAAISTFIIGIILGYLGQRSRMCFVGGIRDFVLVRDTYLLRGLIAFGLTAWLTFPMTGLILGSRPLSFRQWLSFSTTRPGRSGRPELHCVPRRFLSRSRDLSLLDRAPIAPLLALKL